MLIKFDHSCPVLKIHQNITMQPSSNVEIEHFTKTIVPDSKRLFSQGHMVSRLTSF